MHFLVFATDYDGTLAEHGVVASTTLRALRRARDSGRRLLLVTGREVADLKRVFPDLVLFDLVVAENGAVLYEPATGSTRFLAAPPPAAFLEALRARNVPFTAGSVVCATVQPYEHAVLDAIRESGLELQVIFNKGAVMVLPSGVNKATGLARACEQLGISLHNVVGVGDAENDHVFITQCEIGVAVENALPALKTVADTVTSGESGHGVEQFIDEQLRLDCRSLAPKIVRHALTLGPNDGPDATLPVAIPTHHQRTLVVGQLAPSRRAIIETLLGQLIERQYSVLLIDTEGPLTETARRSGLVMLRAQRGGAVVEEITSVFSKPGTSALLETSWLEGATRIAVIADVIRAIAQTQETHGAPHWVFVHDARRIVPSVGPDYVSALMNMDASLALSTAYPADLNARILAGIDHVLATDDIAANHALAAVWKSRHQTGRPLDLRASGAHGLSLAVDSSGRVDLQHFQIAAPRT